MFVLCVLVSYPIQFFVPIERVEKWITRKCDPAKHTQYMYTARFGIVIITLAIAEMVPHLALFISLMGAVACSALALLFPPIIDLLVASAKNEVTIGCVLKNVILLMFALLGFTTGTYSAVSDIIKSFGGGVQET